MQKKTQKHYTADFKAQVVKEMLQEEKAVGQLAAEYRMHRISNYCSPTRCGSVW